MASSQTKINWTFDEPQVELRLRPLREHWEARGPGMLRYACKQLPWLGLPEQVRVHLVPPQGVGGCLKDGYVEFDAVLANPIPDLPEVVHLTWLILQLVANQNKNSAAGLVPISIEAGEFVELCRFDAETIGVALERWIGYAETPDQQSVNGERLIEWWDRERAAVTDGSNPWPDLPEF